MPDFFTYAEFPSLATKARYAAQSTPRLILHTFPSQLDGLHVTPEILCLYSPQMISPCKTSHELPLNVQTT